MLVDGAPETHKLAPYAAQPPINVRPHSVMASSRRLYGRDRDKVEYEIAKFYGNK